MPHDSTAREALTVSEKEILKLIALGKSSEEISKLLYLNIRTVYHHYSEIMSKLNIKNPSDLIKYAINAGYSSKEI